MKKTTKFFITSSLLALTLSSSAVFAEDTTTPDSAKNNFNSEQTKQIESIVHNYLVKNPQVIIESMKNLQQQQMSKEKSRIKTNIEKYSKDVFNANVPGRAAIGNPNGKIVMTEFFSYQCPNCRIMAKAVDDLVKTNPDLQVIFVAWPFENNDDVYAAKAVFAAQKQGKFYELHSALMSAPDLLTKDSIDKTMDTIPGLDVKKAQKEMDDSTIDSALKDNFKLAQTLEFSGTPVFLFTNKANNKFSAVTTGRVPESELKKAIKEVK